MDHNLVHIDLALRMQGDPSLVNHYLEERVILELLNKSIPYNRVYSSIDITKLTALSLKRKNIDDSLAKCLAQLELNTLQTLDRSENKIGVEGARALS